MKKLIVILLLWVGAANTYSQTTPVIDSLRLLLSETPDISTKIKLYTALSWEYHSLDPEKAKRKVNTGLKLSSKSGIDTFKGDLYRSLGDIAIKQDSMNLAEDYYIRSSGYYQTEDKQEDLLMVKNVLGNIKFMQNKYVEAMTHYLNALEIAEKTNLREVQAHLNHNIGAIYFDASSNYNDAINNFSNALELFKALKDTMNMAHVYNSLAEAYFMLGDTSLSHTYYIKAKEYYTITENTTGIALSNVGIARIMRQRGAFKRANYFIFDALNIPKQGDKYYSPPPSSLLSKWYSELGKNFFLLKDYSESYIYFQKAYNLGMLNNQISVISEASKGISDIWTIRNNTDSSYHYYRIHKAYSDSLINKESINKLAMLDAKYDYEQKLNLEKQERLREKQESRVNYLILAMVISGLFLALIIMFLWLKLWRNKVKRLALEQNNLKKELELRNKELTTHVMYKLKKNEFILGIIKKLKHNLYNLKMQNRSLIEEIITDLERDAEEMTWKDFEIRFHRVHVDFNKNLLEKFPDLSTNELRICAFLRLNMNSKEIAAITYQSVNSIDTARSRLRQKLGLTKDDNLIGFLMQY